jgi:hypothetical protein
MQSVGNESSEFMFLMWFGKKDLLVCQLMGKNRAEGSQLFCKVALPFQSGNKRVR